MDKAKTENAVSVVQRRVLARLRHHCLFSLAELNQCIRDLLKNLTNLPFEQLARPTGAEAATRQALSVCGHQAG